jgi:hypothetical protein
MHLGYHELRNMLAKFREEREQRKMMAPSAAAPSSAPQVTPRPAERDHRSSRDDYRERDRGYERHSSRYELVLIRFIKNIRFNTFLVNDVVRGNGPEVLDGGIDYGNVTVFPKLAFDGIPSVADPSHLAFCVRIWSVC